MARKQLTWAELRVGMFVLMCMAILALGIFFVTGAESLTPKYEVRTFLPEVEGLQAGAPVTLDGKEIGSVESILVNSGGDKAHNIEVVMRLQRKYENYVRDSSAAKVKTQGALGNCYVSITRGFSGTAIPPNGVVTGIPTIELSDVVESSASVVQKLNGLTENLQDVVADVKAGQGTLGKLLTDDALYDHLNGTAARAEAMVASTQQGQGTLGKLMTSDELYAKANSAIGNADAILTDVRQQKGTIGKLVEDQAFYNQVHDFVSHGDSLITGVQQGKGTLGKLATDDALYNNMREASANVRDASAKLNSNGNTAGKMFTDPQLYDNLTNATAEMRSLIADFRTNPKKFLHVKVTLF
jgi:phospholipid/cholesterol/gamma-HCH transport system substrate-binding protein